MTLWSRYRAGALDRTVRQLLGRVRQRTVRRWRKGRFRPVMLSGHMTPAGRRYCAFAGLMNRLARASNVKERD